MQEKILFDLIPSQPSPDAKYHGGSEYTKFIFKAALDFGYYNFDVIYREDYYIDNDIIDECKKHGIKMHTVTDTINVKAIINKGYHSFFSAMPCFTYINFDYSKTKFIYTIHGARKLEIKTDKYEYMYLKDFRTLVFYVFNNWLGGLYFYKKEYLSYKRFFEIKNKMVLTVSNHSKYSLLSLFPTLKENEINVCYSPIELDDIAIYNEKSNYILLVSANRWIKNNYRAILALDSLFSKGFLADKHVVVLGAERVEYLKKVKNKNRFTFEGYVPKSKLLEYMKKAFCLLYPSLNEGFGYPPVQAMNYGTPVIASAISSIPEVCDNAALYFNPYSVKEIENRILQLSNDIELYNTLQNRCIERCKILKKIQEETITRLLNIIFINNKL